MAGVKHKPGPFITKSVHASITLDKGTISLALELKKLHNAGSITTYVKGLIALDALQTKGPLDFTDVPAWLVVAYKLDVVKGKVHSITMRSEPANAASITESKSEKLSRTEGEILSLIREGLTDKEIAADSRGS